MATFSTLDFVIDSGIARITLNRPDAANGISMQLAQELLQASLACRCSTAVRAVLLTGKGRMFCAGGDLNSFVENAGNLEGFIKELTTYLHAAIANFAHMRAPLIVAVTGAAAGAGFSLAALGEVLDGLHRCRPGAGRQRQLFPAAHHRPAPCAGTDPHESPPRRRGSTRVGTADARGRGYRTGRRSPKAGRADRRGPHRGLWRREETAGHQLRGDAGDTDGARGRGDRRGRYLARRHGRRRRIPRQARAGV